MTYVYICIPVWNEERTIGPVLWKIRETMAEYGRDYHLLVVDDASTDRTPEVLARYARVLPLTVHRNEGRQGYAAALEQAIREAVRRSEYPKRDAVVTLQGDFTEDPGLIPDLVKRVEGGADVVASASARENRGAPAALRWSRKAFEWLARRRGWPEPLSNPVSGFRAYRVISLKKALDEASDRPLIRRDGWLADLSLLQAVVPHGRRFEEVDAATRFERLQRASRFDLRESLRQVRGVLGAATERSGPAAAWVDTARPERVTGAQRAESGALERGNGRREGGERRGGRSKGRGRGKRRRGGSKGRSGPPPGRPAESS